MRNPISVAVILQLAIIIIGSNGQYEFGDIISFERTYKTKTFKHFAVYVGDRHFNGKQPGQDIFHRVGLDEGAPVPDCVFGVLMNEVGTPRKENYLDNWKNKLTREEIRKGSDQDISKRIEAMITQEGCGKYNVRFNNCEHLATYVRYGYSVTKQKGTDAAGFCLIDLPMKCITLDALVKRIEDNAIAEQRRD